MLETTIIAAVLAGVPAGPEPAADAGPPLSLSWSAPPGCPDREAMVQQVQRLTDARVVSEPEAPLRVHVDVALAEVGYRAVLQLDRDGTSQTRDLTADDCALLSRAVAVVVAVAADPIGVATTLEEKRSPEPAQSTDRAEPKAPPPRAVLSTQPPKSPNNDPKRTDPNTDSNRTDPTPKDPSTPLEFGTRLSLAVGGLILPTAGVGLSLAGYLGTPQFHVRVVGQYWPPRNAELQSLPDAGATFQLATGGVRACPVLQTGRWRFPLCAGVDVGAVIGQGEGEDLRVQRSATAVWSAVVLQPGVEVTLTPRFGLWAAFEGAVSLNRPRFHLDNGGELHAVGAFGPRGLIGVVLHNRRRIP